MSFNVIVSVQGSLAGVHKLDYGVSQPAVSYSPSLMGSCYSPLGGVAMGSQHPAPPPEPGHISPTFGTPGNQVQLELDSELLPLLFVESHQPTSAFTLKNL